MSAVVMDFMGFIVLFCNLFISAAAYAIPERFYYYIISSI